MYSGYRITFDSTGSWSFNNDTAHNFGVDHGSPSRADKHKKNFLVLGNGPTFGSNGSFSSPEKKFITKFSIGKTKFRLSLHYNANNSYLFVNGKKILNIKLTIKMLTFQLKFVSEVHAIDLVLLSLEKYLSMEMCMILQFY